MSEYVVKLPKPHGKQQEFISSPAKRKVIVAGRRGGKTTGTSILAAEKLLDNRRILYAAPTQEQTSAFWSALKTYFMPLIAAGVLYKNETERILEFPGGGRVRAKTAWNADTLRGDHADLLIMEEWSLMDVSAWDEVGAPMLLDNNGDAVFIFTPKRRNHAYNTYAKAIGDTSGRWAAWHFTSFDNPHLSTEALAEITADMTDEAYRQEILAEFLENEGAVFRNLLACMNAPKNAQPSEHRGHRIVMGADWGKQADYTALSVGCVDCRLEVELDRFNQIDYAFQRQRLEALAGKWSVSGILAESNAMGVPIIEELQRSGLPVRPFNTSATTKPPLIESLALTFEREEWQFLNDTVALTELEAYERKISPSTGRSSYSAPDGLHDDTVMARALMREAAEGKQRMRTGRADFYAKAAQAAQPTNTMSDAEIARLLDEAE